MPFHNQRQGNAPPGGQELDLGLDPWGFGPGSEAGWPGQGAELDPTEIPDPIEYAEPAPEVEALPPDRQVAAPYTVPTPYTAPAIQQAPPEYMPPPPPPQGAVPPPAPGVHPQWSGDPDPSGMLTPKWDEPFRAEWDQGQRWNAASGTMGAPALPQLPSGEQLDLDLPAGPPPQVARPTPQGPQIRLESQMQDWDTPTAHGGWAALPAARQITASAAEPEPPPPGVQPLGPSIDNGKYPPGTLHDGSAGAYAAGTGQLDLLDRADTGDLTAGDLAWLQPYFNAFDFDPADDPQAGRSGALGAARSAPFRVVLRRMGATGAIGGGVEPPVEPPVVPPVVPPTVVPPTVVPPVTPPPPPPKPTIVGTSTPPPPPLVTEKPPVSGNVQTDLTVPLTGSGATDPSTTDYPFSIPQQQTIGNVQVGEDPISRLMNAGLAATAWGGGTTPTNLAGQTQGALRSIMGRGGQGGGVPTEQGWFMENTLQDLLQGGGRLPPDVQRRAQEMETLRDPIEAFRRAQMAQGQAALASRGLLGQGPEAGFMEGLEQRLAPMYAQAGQQVALGEAERADQRYRDALQLASEQGQVQAQRREDRLSDTLALATGMTEEQSRNMLATAQTWTERQKMLAGVVGDELSRNQLFNQFLAEFGMDRDQTLNDIKEGRLAALIPALNQFLSTIQTSAQGFVPYYEESSGVRTARAGD